MEARLPNAPFEMFSSDTGPLITAEQMIKHVFTLSLNFVVASIAFRQAQVGYARSLAQMERRKAASRRLKNDQLPIATLPEEILS